MPEDNELDKQSKEEEGLKFTERVLETILTFKHWKEAAAALYGLVSALGAIPLCLYFEKYLKLNLSDQVMHPPFWLAICGLLSLFLAVVWMVMIAVHFFYRIATLREENEKVIGFLKRAIKESYEKRLFEDYSTIIGGLRSLFIFLAIYPPLYKLGQVITGQINGFSIFEQVTVFVQVALITAYTSLMFVASFKQRQILVGISRKPKSTSEIVRQSEAAEPHFWNLAKVDLCFSCLLVLFTVDSASPNYFSFILPIMAIWLLEEAQALRIFCFVIGSLVVKTMFIGGLVGSSFLYFDQSSGGAVSAYGGIANLVGAVALWGAIGLVLTVLRHLRSKSKMKEKEIRNQYENEHILKRALEMHCSQQGFAIFAKDSLRRFIYANQLFLEMLQPLVGKINFQHLTPEGKLTLASILQMTDKDFGIDRPRYENNDLDLINGKKSVIEDYEPAPFEDCEFGSIIWTKKIAIPSEDGKNTLGIIGSICPGEPQQLQNMRLFFADRVQMYASMKDERGNIVWANEVHLKKLERKIESLLEAEGKTAEEIKKLSRAAKLRAIDDGKGPTDVMLYDEVGYKYKDRDAQIMNRAREHVGSEEEFTETMSELVNEWFSNIQDYPKSGWYENHRFPDDNEGAWVEVWKWPWWEPDLSSDKKKWIVKGVLVLFKDAHEVYMRKSVVWRWLREHLQRATEANASILRKGPLPRKSDPVVRLAIHDLSVPAIIQKMLLWFQALVNKTQPVLPKDQQAIPLKTFLGFLPVLKRMYRDKVEIIFETSLDDYVLQRNGNVLFGILVAILLNKLDYAEKSGKSASVVVQVDSVPHKLGDISGVQCLKITIINQDVPALSKEDCDQINSLRKLNQDGTPGGSHFLAFNLVGWLIRSVLSGPVLWKREHCFSFESGESDSGPFTKVVLYIPKAAFDE